MFIVDLNATLRKGFANLTAYHQKLLLEIGARIDGVEFLLASVKSKFVFSSYLGFDSKLIQGAVVV